MPGEGTNSRGYSGQRPSSFCNPAFSLGVNFGKSSPCQKMRTGSLNSEYREGPSGGVGPNFGPNFVPRRIPRAVPGGSRAIYRRGGRASS